MQSRRILLALAALAVLTAAVLPETAARAAVPAPTAFYVYGVGTLTNPAGGPRILMIAYVMQPAGRPPMSYIGFMSQGPAPQWLGSFNTLNPALGFVPGGANLTVPGSWAGQPATLRLTIRNSAPYAPRGPVSVQAQIVTAGRTIALTGFQGTVLVDPQGRAGSPPAVR